MLRRTAIAAVLILGLSAPQLAHAQRRGLGETVGPEASQQQAAARRGVQSGQNIPMSQVQAILNRRTPGKMQDANLVSAGERPVYIVRWVTSDGKRIDYTVDARTGAVLSTRGG